MTPASADLPAIPAHRSLRAKAWFATLTLLVYLLGAAAYIAIERGKVDSSIQRLDQLARHEKALALAEASVDAALVDATQASSAAQGEPASPLEMRLSRP